MLVLISCEEAALGSDSATACESMGDTHPGMLCGCCMVLDGNPLGVFEVPDMTCHMAFEAECTVCAVPEVVCKCCGKAMSADKVNASEMS